MTIAALIFLGVSAGEVHAIDHGNLDENHPLRLEDPYPIASGEFAVEAGGGLALHRRGPSRGRFPVEMLYGALPNLQLGIGSILSTDPREIDHRPKSGDLRLSALYNFNQETIGLPAFAVKVGLDVPTGVNARGTSMPASSSLWQAGATSTTGAKNSRWAPVIRSARRGSRERR